MEQGPGVLYCDEHKKGLLPRVVDGLFGSLKSSAHISAYTVQLSMVNMLTEVSHAHYCRTPFLCAVDVLLMSRWRSIWRR